MIWSLILASASMLRRSCLGDTVKSIKRAIPSLLGLCLLLPLVLVVEGNEFEHEAQPGTDCSLEN